MSDALWILAICLGLATCSYVDTHNTLEKQRFELQKEAQKAGCK